MANLSLFDSNQVIKAIYDENSQALRVTVDIRHWQAPVDAVANLPTTDNSIGDVRLAIDTESIYYWDGDSWEIIAGGGGGGGSQDTFRTITLDNGDSVVAESATDTLTLTSPHIRISGAGSTDTVTIDFVGTGTNSFLVGSGSSTADNSVAIGTSSNATHNNSIVLGSGASSTAANQVLIGGTNSNTDDLYVGTGVTQTSPQSQVSINANGASGNNQPGPTLRIASGKGTGEGTAGTVSIATSTTGTAGATLQTLANRLVINENTAQFNVPPLPPVFTDTSRPSAGTAGRVIYNSTVNQLQVDNGTSWIYCDCTSTGTHTSNSSGPVGPPGGAVASVKDFRIAIPSRVDVNTDLNVATAVTYDFTAINGLNTWHLDIDGSVFSQLGAPSVPGFVRTSVTLSGIDTSTAKTIRFQLVGETTSGTDLRSYTQFVTVRNLLDQEFVYYGFTTTNVPATDPSDITTLSKEGVAGGEGFVNITTGTATVGQFFAIFIPATHTVSNIIQTNLGNADVTSAFTLTSTVRTVNSQQYNSYVLGAPSGLVAGFNAEYTVNFTSA